MEDPSPASTLLAEAVEISAWLEADRATPYSERLHRDRSIGLMLSGPAAARGTRAGGGSGAPSGEHSRIDLPGDAQSRAAASRTLLVARGVDHLARVRAWWRALAERDAQAAQGAARASERAVRLERARRSIGLLSVCIGAFFGAAAAAAIFHYDGTWPVNVVTVLAVLVLLQLLLVAATLILMLPRSAGLRALQNVIGSLHLGALIASLAAAVQRRLQSRAGSPDRERDDALFWRHARGPGAARCARWQALAWSQSAAIAFNVAALGTALALIAFTDLAFGWSTTLRLSSEHVLRLTNLLAWPWHAFWPQAVPGPELIESSRYFRLASAPPSATAAQALTGWWPFLLAAMLTYGLLPRCLLRALAAWRLRIAMRRWLLEDPQVQALLERMDRAELVLGAQQRELTAGEVAASAARKPVAGSPPQARDRDHGVVAIVWAGALSAAQAQAWASRQLGRHIAQLEEAGGGRDLEADRQAIARLREQIPASVLVFVRAWEAPLLDLRDFLGSLRAELGSSAAIVVAPVGAAGTAPTAEQVAVWARWLAGIADPALYLEAPRPGPRAEQAASEPQAPGTPGIDPGVQSGPISGPLPGAHPGGESEPVSGSGPGVKPLMERSS